MIRLFMGRLFNRLVTAGTELDFLDTQCGFKAFRTEVARLVFHLVPIDRFAFDVEVLACSHRLGLAIAEVPVHWKHVPGSSVQPLHDSITMLTDVFSSRLGFRRSSAVPAVSISGPPSSGPPSSGPPSSGPPSRPGGADRPLAEHPCIDQVSAALAGRGGPVPLPVVTGQTETLVLFPLVDRADVSDYVQSLRAALPDHTMAQRSLSLSDLLALGSLAGRIHSSVPYRLPSTGSRDT